MLMWEEAAIKDDVIEYDIAFNIIYIMRTNVSGGKICISAVMIAWSIESCEATFSSMICVEAPHDPTSTFTHG